MKMNMTLKHFFEVYPPKRMWRKMWIGLADLPMMPQHRAKCLKMAGVNIKGRAMIYGGVGVDTVYPDSIYDRQRCTYHRWHKDSDSLS